MYAGDGEVPVRSLTLERGGSHDSSRSATDHTPSGLRATRRIRGRRPMTSSWLHPDELGGRRSLVVFAHLPERSAAQPASGTPDAKSVCRLIDESQRIAHCQV